MATRPSYTNTPHVGGVVASAANTNRDGTGTLATVFTAPIAGGALAGGSRIERVVVTAQAVVTDGMIRLFIDSGAARWLYKEIEVSALAPAASVPAFHAEVETTDLTLPAGWSLKATTHNAEAFALLAFGGDF